jgi:hypothetical protein
MGRIICWEEGVAVVMEVVFVYILACLRCFCRLTLRLVDRRKVEKLCISDLGVSAIAEERRTKIKERANPRTVEVSGRQPQKGFSGFHCSWFCWTAGIGRVHGAERKLSNRLWCLGWARCSTDTRDDFFSLRSMEYS